MAAAEINAITLACTDMSVSVVFYRALGFETVYGGPTGGVQGHELSFARRL